MRTIRVAFLTVGDLAPAIVSKHGIYADLFRTLFKRSQPESSKRDVQIAIDDWDVRNGVWPTPGDMENYQAILIPGSAAAAFDDTLPWLAPLLAFIRDTFHNYPQVMIIGFCFGHQVIARALGGECEKNDEGWEIGTTEVKLSDAGKRIFGRDVVNIQQMHRDHVPSVPPSLPFQLLGSTPRSAVQGLLLYYPSSTDVHVLTMQGHPEFSVGDDIVTTIIEEREKKGVFDRELATKGRVLALKESEGVSVVGGCLWGILGVKGA